MSWSLVFLLYLPGFLLMAYGSESIRGKIKAPRSQLLEAAVLLESVVIAALGCGFAWSALGSGDQAPNRLAQATLMLGWATLAIRLWLRLRKVRKAV
jgi:hypothetical protein